MTQHVKDVFMTPDPKPKTPRNKKYKDWIKTQPCLKCGRTPCDPHHYTQIGGGCGWGMKVSDYWCVPMCRECHIGAHDDKWFLSETPYEEGKEPDDRWVLVRIIKYHDEYLVKEAI